MNVACPLAAFGGSMRPWFYNDLRNSSSLELTKYYCVNCRYSAGTILINLSSTQPGVQVRQQLLFSCYWIPCSFALQKYLVVWFCDINVAAQWRITVYHKILAYIIFRHPFTQRDKSPLISARQSPNITKFNLQLLCIFGTLLSCSKIKSWYEPERGEIVASSKGVTDSGACGISLTVSINW